MSNNYIEKALSIDFLRDYINEHLQDEEPLEKWDLQKFLQVARQCYDYSASNDCPYKPIEYDSLEKKLTYRSNMRKLQIFIVTNGGEVKP